MTKTLNYASMTVAALKAEAKRRAIPVGRADRTRDGITRLLIADDGSVAVSIPADAIVAAAEPDEVVEVAAEVDGAVVDGEPTGPTYEAPADLIDDVLAENPTVRAATTAKRRATLAYKAMVPFWSLFAPLDLPQPSTKIAGVWQRFVGAYPADEITDEVVAAVGALVLTEAKAAGLVSTSSLPRATKRAERHPRLVEAYAARDRIKASGEKRKTTRLNHDEWVARLRSIRAEFPTTTYRAEMEYAAWVDLIAMSDARFKAAWAEVDAEIAAEGSPTSAAA